MAMVMKAAILAAALVGLAGSLTTAVAAEPSTKSHRQLYEDARDSVVTLYMHSKDTGRIASGFFVSDHVVATNYHIIREMTEGYARLTGLPDRYRVVGVVAAAPEHDLALLAIADARVRPLPLADENAAMVGDDMFVIGNPYGQAEGTFTCGMVSNFARFDNSLYMLFTAPICPGNSGGPILDARGQVIGMVSGSKVNSQNFNRGVPVRYLKALDLTAPPVPLEEYTKRATSTKPQVS